MKNDEFGDWRLLPIGRLEHDLPAAFPGGPSHKAGTPLYMSSLAETPETRYGFVTPSTPAMAFDIAIHSAEAAKKTALTIQWQTGPSPSGTALTVPPSDATKLFQYFQECMVCVMFSFVSLEAFCNHAIVANRKPIEVKQKKGLVSLSPEEAERQLSTEIKIREVLPKILGVRTPAGIAVWEEFRRLRDARDSVAHFKMRDQHPSPNAGAESTLYFQFLGKDPMIYPRAAIAILNHFHPEKKPRWLKALAHV